MGRKVTNLSSEKALLFTPLFLAAALGLCRTRNYSANIIFDFGGVLVNMSWFALYRKVGLLNFLYCSLMSYRNPRNLLFNALNDIDLPDIPNNGMCDQYGNKLPKGLIHWFKGTSSLKIKEAVERLLEENPHYSSAITKKLIRTMIRIVFTPEIFANAVSFNWTGIAFVQECIKRGHKVYLLSNWDAESFEFVRRKYSSIFDLFDGIVISGQVKLAKPDPKIFYYLLNRYQVDPSATVFIDDQEENLKAAEALSIHGIKCQKIGWRSQQDFESVRMALVSWQMKRILAEEQGNSSPVNIT